MDIVNQKGRNSMSSIEAHLPNHPEDGSFCDMSDESGLRDAAEIVKTTSALPMSGAGKDEAKPNEGDQTEVEATQVKHAGCGFDDEEPKLTEIDNDGSMSVIARGGSSGNSPNETAKPADSIKSLRDFEAFLRSSGYSRAVAASIARNGWMRSGKTETVTASDPAQEHVTALIDLFRV